MKSCFEGRCEKIQTSKTQTTDRITRKCRPRKRTPRKHRPQKVNTDPENGQNVVCVLIEKLRSFIKSMGREKENLKEP